MNMSAKNKELATELAMNMAELSESAFGWDSVEAAQCRKEVGLRYKESAQYREAILQFKLALEAYEVIGGVEDPSYSSVAKLVKECEASLAVDEEPVEDFLDVSKMGFIKSIKAIRKKNSMKVAGRI